ncbi:MAG: hypothetical protein FWD13_10965 [Treponema sp.]|nr:hypothetical protein [Treponema sp.]
MKYSLWFYSKVYIIIFLILLIPVILLLVLIFLRNVNDHIAIKLFWTFVGASISQLLACIASIITSKSKNILCTYQKLLDNFGIREIFESETSESYQESLKKELDRAIRKCGYFQKPIIMMGVSLQSYFNNCDICNKISDISKDIQFNIYICDPENNALLNRKKWIEELKETQGNNNIEIFDFEIETSKIVQTSINIINDLIDNERKIELNKYKIGIPFATIIFINNRIYYTPNMFKPENWGIKFKESQLNIKTNLSFCISRTSSFGLKLENLFETIYKNVNMV